MPGRMSSTNKLLVRLRTLFDEQHRGYLVLGLVALVGGLIFVFSRSTPDLDTGPTPLVVSMGEAGKAGDVVVTEEAMKLAEIELSPAEVRQVEERLQVTGVIETGGNHFAKVTPLAPGKVYKILAFEGDDIREGQVLALLESAELARAQADYRQAKAHLRVYRKNLVRQRELASLGEFGSTELEESKNRSIDARSQVEEAKRSVAGAQTDLQIAKNLLLQATEDYETRRAQLERAESLPKAISRQRLERLRADTKIAKSEVAVAQANVAHAQEGVETAKNLQPLATKRWQVSESALRREEEIYAAGHSRSRELVEAEAALELAEVELEGTAEAVRLLGGRPGEGSGIALLAPISGKVQSTSLTLGESVSEEQVAFTLVNLEQVWAELSLAPKDLAKAKVGDAVELQADSAPGQVFLGHLASIAPAADDTTRTVSARMIVENPTAALKVGSFVKASIITDIRHERLTVPETALQEHTGRATIYVANTDATGAFEVRHVILGETGEGWREISEGLAPNEVLATQGTFYLKSEALKKSLSDGCCAVAE
jgi:RND family efflux transporter MFP subunit